ncbi:MAG: methionyl-tRNA formyltransferase [Candidatus Shapirobacteria bacterium]
MISLVFFGSFQNYSTLTLQKIIDSKLFIITAVITTPPRPGNHGVITKTHTHTFCEQNNIPVYPLENLNSIPSNIKQPDFILVSGYGKIIPDNWLNFPKIMSINAHQSLLPNYAGRFPVQWALLNSESETGVTLIKMSGKFDKGDILVQSKIGITSNDTNDSLYTKLYDLSAKLFIDTVLQIDKIIPIPQTGTGFYARQLTKQDGFVTNFENLDKLTRALNPWPGVWTYVTDKSNKKLILKIITINKNNQPEIVLIEGKKPTKWSEISQHYTLTL